MFIPKALSFYLNRLSGFSKNTVRLQPLNRTTFGPGDQIVFRFPSNALIDLHSLSMLMKVSTTNGVLPRYSSSIIQRLDVFANGVPLALSGLNDYNTLYNIKNNLTLNYSQKLERAVLEYGQEVAAADPALSNADWAITDWLGFLGGTWNRYIPASILGDLEIRITLAPSNIMIQPNAANACTYSIADVRMVLEVLTVDPLYYQMLAKKLESGEPLVIPLKNFASFNGAAAGGSSSTTFSIASQSLDALYGVCRAATFDTPATTESGGTSRYFAFTSLGDAATYQYQVDTTQVPQWAATNVEAYVLAKNSMDGGGGNALYANSIGTLSAWKLQRFTHCASLEMFCDQPNERLSSGVNTMGSQIPIIWRVSGGDAAHRTTVFAEMTSTIQVQAGQLITVVP